MSKRDLILVMSASDDGDEGGEGESNIALKPKEKVKKPPLYKVFLLNDDYTPMDFVVLVLRKFFGKDVQEATKVMFQVHNRGVGLCGVYPYEVAETKVTQVMSLARQHEHPLKCTMEKE